MLFYFRQFCGVCKGMLEYQGISDKAGNIAKPRQATAFRYYYYCCSVFLSVL